MTPGRAAEPRSAGLRQARCLTGGHPPISEPEIAFVVLHDQPDARAAQRRPGAEHRARPVLPEARPTVCRGRADLFYGKPKASASGCRKISRWFIWLIMASIGTPSLMVQTGGLRNATKVPSLRGRTSSSRAFGRGHVGDLQPRLVPAQGLAGGPDGDRPEQDGFRERAGVVEGRRRPAFATAGIRPRDVMIAVELVEQAARHGAVLFRGFPVSTADDFDAFVGAFDLPNFPYDESLSNAVRVNRTPRVFTANEAPPSVTIYLHHEMAQTPVYPSRLFFFCEQPATEGGATPICRSDVLWERLAALCPSFARDCEEKGLRYTNVMPTENDPGSGMGRGWQGTLRANDRDGAEERLRALGYSWEWLPDGCLRATTPVLPAVRRLPGWPDVLLQSTDRRVPGMEGHPERPLAGHHLRRRDPARPGLRADRLRARGRALVRHPVDARRRGARGQLPRDARPSTVLRDEEGPRVLDRVRNVRPRARPTAERPTRSSPRAWASPPPTSPRGREMVAPLLAEGVGRGSPAPLLAEGVGRHRPAPFLAEGEGRDRPAPLFAEGIGGGLPAPLLAEGECGGRPPSPVEVSLSRGTSAQEQRRDAGHDGEGPCQDRSARR